MNTRQPNTLFLPTGTTPAAIWSASAGILSPAMPTAPIPGPWVQLGAWIIPSRTGADDSAWTETNGTLVPNVDATVGTPTVETPTGTKNGSNLEFTLSGTPVFLIVRKGSEVMTQTTHYTFTGTTLTFTAGNAPAATDILTAIYWT